MLIKSVNKICPVCYKYSSHSVDIDRYYQFIAENSDIDKAFPDYSIFKRRFLKTGTCYSCQEKMYNQPSPDNEKNWGKQLGTCNGCERPIYKKDLNKEGLHVCKICKATQIVKK